MIRNFNVAKEKFPKSLSYVQKNLVPFIHCKRCGAHVLKSENQNEYEYQCVYCDEDLYECETYQDKKRKEINDYDFFDLVYKTSITLDFNEGINKI